MNRIEMTDNLYYSEMDSYYIDGNLKMQAVNLPVFVQPKDLSSLSNLTAVQESIPRSSFKAPLLVRINRLLQVILVGLCAVAICAYSLDVIMSQKLSISQEQARRLSEQNCELSAKLLKSISFQGIQESVLGHSAKQSHLCVPEEVLVAAEISPVQIRPFIPAKHHLPLMSGY